MKYDIITVGGAVVDAFLDTDVAEKSGEMCYDVGTKILVKNVWFATGGGGTNTAVAFSKFGLKTGYLGKLGNDDNADKILRELKKEKVDFLGKKGKGATGFSVVLDSKEHNRTILTYKGESENLRFSEVGLKKLKTSWFYFSSMVGETLRMQEKLVKFAKKNHIKIAFNPSSYLTKQGPGAIKKILKHTHVLILNEEEARGLVRKGDLFKGLHKLGPKIVCITYGKKGSKVSDGERVYVSKPRNVKVVEKTGAGDAYASGFLAGAILFNDIKKAIKLATLNAESVIQKKGAKNGLLTVKDVKKI